MLEAIADVVLVKPSIASTFLLSFCSVQQSGHSTVTGQATGDRFMAMTTFDVFVLLIICAASARGRTTTSSRQQRTLQCSLIAIVSAPSFDHSILLSAADRLLQGHPWAGQAADFSGFILFLQQWGCSILAASNGQAGKRRNSSSGAMSNAQTHEVGLAIRLLSTVADVEMKLLTTQSRSAISTRVRDMLLTALLNGCLPQPVGTEVAGQVRPVISESCQSHFLFGSASSVGVKHLELVCSDILVRLAEECPHVFIDLSLRVEDVVTRLLTHSSNSIGQSDLGIANPILQRLLRVASSIAVADKNSTRRNSNLIFVQKRLSSFSSMHQPVLRAAIFMGTHIIYQELCSGTDTLVEAGNQSAAIEVAELILRVTTLLTDPSTQVAAYNAVALCASVLPLPFAMRLLRSCAWPACRQRQLFSHSVSSSSGGDSSLHHQSRERRVSVLEFGCSTAKADSLRCHRASDLLGNS